MVPAASCSDADVEAAGAHAVDEPVEVGQARRRRVGARPRPGAAMSSAARSSCERLVAGVLDGGEGRAGLLGLLVEQVEGDAGLHVDQRDVVGEHVVQLLGQREALLVTAPLLLLDCRPLAARRACSRRTRTTSETASTTTSQPATKPQCDQPSVVGPWVDERARPRSAT